jgi:hypothetical protein
MFFDLVEASNVGAHLAPNILNDVRNMPELLGPVGARLRQLEPLLLAVALAVLALSYRSHAPLQVSSASSSSKSLTALAGSRTATVHNGIAHSLPSARRDGASRVHTEAGAHLRAQRRDGHADSQESGQLFLYLAGAITSHAHRLACARHTRGWAKRCSPSERQEQENGDGDHHSGCQP